MEFLKDILPTGVALICVLIGLPLLNWLLSKREYQLGTNPRLTRQIIMLLASASAFLTVVLCLPLEQETKNNLMGLLGILVTAVLTLSSTSFVANAMAGMMLRIIRNFRIGDFVEIEHICGRVTERGLFHTEIQTEERDLLTLPNMFLVQNPVTVIRNSGTIISAELSLGYDVDHNHATAILIDAAKALNLEEPFVRVTTLGDFAVGYKVCGFLKDVSALLTTESDLRRAVLDAMHQAGVEIVSPAFMNQRQLSTEKRMIPEPATPELPQQSSSTPEQLIFDKADAAKHHDDLVAARSELQQVIHSLEQEIAKSTDFEAKLQIHQQLSRRNSHLNALNRAIDESKSSLPEGSL